ncbi:hypothetical protein CONLIGDRAFT_635285 [Coniochaeta ligniaria NRRL 30616]|uniref:Uncharacterized protein n=1 Tax=Coniochaeta ligniaria NRRL 30616 TaxID=1408157 RepID=A0A1J7II07_9PEZI|nr:hypothetical protein CONLIGDRAFT_635285 [Coniochaeta ligniaria NRRL 30616]
MPLETWVVGESRVGTDPGRLRRSRTIFLFCLDGDHGVADQSAQKGTKPSGDADVRLSSTLAADEGSASWRRRQEGVMSLFG